MVYRRRREERDHRSFREKEPSHNRSVEKVKIVNQYIVTLKKQLLVGNPLQKYFSDRRYNDNDVYIIHRFIYNDK